jgi:hypothetical protein
MTSTEGTPTTGWRLDDTATHILDHLRQHHPDIPDGHARRAATQLVDYLEAVTEQRNPRLAQLFPADEAEAAYMLRNAIHLVPELRQDIDEDSGRRHFADSQTVRCRSLLLDLDRCCHGRHQGERCYGCPTGVSPGNPHLAPGVTIGHNYAGDRWVIPTERYDRRWPETWRISEPDPTCVQGVTDDRGRPA